MKIIVFLCSMLIHTYPGRGPTRPEHGSDTDVNEFILLNVHTDILTTDRSSLGYSVG